jgi:transcriptional regulator with XRE-family HTH domain
MKSSKALLGERIRELRKAKGLTQDQFAELIGVEQKHVSRVELGKSFPPLERLEKMAQVLEVHLKDLFDFVRPLDVKASAEGVEAMLEQLDDEHRKIASKIFVGVVEALMIKCSK